MGVERSLVIFEINLCSATSMKGSRQDLFSDMADHRAILKNNQNTHYSLIFQDRTMFSHTNGKLASRSLQLYGWT